MIFRCVVLILLISLLGCSSVTPPLSVQETVWKADSELRELQGVLHFWNDFQCTYKVEPFEDYYLGYYKIRQDTIDIRMDRIRDGQNHKESEIDPPWTFTFVLAKDSLRLEAYDIHIARPLDTRKARFYRVE